jgi:lysophospholipase L1-like esterase
VLKNPGKYNIDNVMDDCLVDDFGRSHTINLPNVLQGKQNSIVKINGALKSTTLIDAYRLGKGYQLGYVSLCDKPNKYVFWDAVHPSAAAHQILAELVEKQLENGAKVSA